MNFDCGYEASEGGGVVCRVTGEIDLANSPDLKDRAVEAMKSPGRRLSLISAGSPSWTSPVSGRCWPSAGMRP